MTTDPLLQTHHILPGDSAMSKEIEAKVLTGVLSDRYLLTRTLNEGLSADVFSESSYRLIFRIAHEMSQIPGQVIDWITIENTLKAKGWDTPEVCRAIEHLEQSSTPEMDQVMAYVEILKDKHLRQRMLELAHQMADFCNQQGEHKNEDFVDFNSRIIQSLIDLQKQRVKKRIAPIQETIQEIREITQTKKTSGKQLLGFSIKPFERLEGILSGIRKGFYYGVAGPPPAGKNDLHARPGG